MAPSLEHDYIGSSTTMEASRKISCNEGCGLVGSLKETELRLGLPGSERPEKTVIGLGFSKGCFASSGAKRGFLDTIDGCGKWVFAGGSGFEVELGKGGGLVSARVENGRKVNDGGLAPKAAGGEKKGQDSSGTNERGTVPAAKAQVVGWPPIRNYRKNTMAANPSKNNANSEEKQTTSCVFVKVSMDGAPYLRKIDLKSYCNYKELSAGLEKMFSCFTIGQCGSHVLPSKDGLKESRLTDLIHGSEYVLTYEDKDGDWMLVGDVPWNMFTETCKRLRIMKGSEAIGLAPSTIEKCKSRN